MQLIFNELSVVPLAPNSAAAEYRFKKLANCFKAISKEFPFRHVLFPKAYREMRVTEDSTFIEWISGTGNRELTGLILGLCINPYVDDLEEDEMNSFFDGTYSIPDADCPTNEEPIGLPVAHIKSSPSISLHSEIFWEKSLITVKKSGDDGNIIFDVVNFCQPENFNSDAFGKWYSEHLSKDLSSEEKLIKFLDYKKYKIVFDGDFFTQFLEWSNQAPQTHKHLLSLLKDVELHPFVGGIGKTEPLKYQGKTASKRITHGDRLTYTVDNDIVTFMACKGHYI